MSNIPLIANLDDPTSPIDRETNLLTNEGLFRGASPDDEMKSSARDQLLLKEGSGEKKQESRRPSSIYLIVLMLNVNSRPKFPRRTKKEFSKECKCS